MTEVVLDIKQWGNNLGVRLTVVDGQIIITPVIKTGNARATLG